MLTLISFFIVLLITIIQSANVSVTFPTFSVNTDIGICTCDLTAGKCDPLCCCDDNCSLQDKNVFGCSGRENQYTNSTPPVSSIQPTCFQNLSIMTSDTPYVILKMGELVCVDYQRYTGSQYYQQPTTKTLDPAVFVRTINTENSVLPRPELPTNLTNYQVGTPILMYDTRRSAPTYYSLPISSFNNVFCSGSQSITYMNDFTSTCSQYVDNTTCNGALNPSTYMDPLCLIRSPSNPSDSSLRTCDSSNVSSSSFAGSVCSNALRSLTITIFYKNPDGIQNVTVTPTSDPASTSGLFEQTFTVKFIKSVPSSSSDVTRNPGYRQGANIIGGIQSGSTIGSIRTSDFVILKSSLDGSCSESAERIPIRFGENIRSTCKYNVATPSTCPNLLNLLIPINSSNLYVAAYSDSNPSNLTRDWLPVISCTSEIGSSNGRDCQTGIITNVNSDTLCYVRLNIQIAYTNIGSILNPQPVLSAVIFHYQGLPASAISGTLLIFKSVTFQDISNAPIIQEGRIPAPDTRLPSDFFYPFTVSQATKSMTFSSFYYFFIGILFIVL